MKKIAFKYSFLLRTLIVLLCVVGGVIPVWGGHGGPHYASVSVTAKPTGQGKVYMTTNSAKTPAASDWKDDMSATWNCDDGVADEQDSRTYYVHAKATSGNHFVKWSSNSSGTDNKSTNNPYAYSTKAESTRSGSPTQNNIYAIFEANPVYTATFLTATNGTYKYSYGGSAEVTVTSEHSVTTDQNFTFTAIPADGYMVYGWYTKSGNTKTYFEFLSATIPSYALPSNVTIGVDFVPEGTAIFQIKGTNQYFTDLAAAITACGSAAKTIVPINDGIVAAGNYIIPSNVTLLIPYDNTYTVTTTPPDVQTWEALARFRTLSLANGVNITVNGAICVGGRQFGTSAGNPGPGSVLGAYGVLDMSAGGHITVTNGGKLYAYGFITGNGDQSTAGTITIQNGGKVYENLVINDLHGGGGTAACVNGDRATNSYRLFPFNQYFVQNIEPKMTIEYGGIETAYFDIQSNQGGKQNAAKLIGNTSDYLFQLSSGASITKWYDANRDYQCYKIQGNMTMNGISVDAVVATLSSTTFILPVNNNMEITVADDAVLDLPYAVKFQAGAGLIIEEGGVVNVKKDIYFYDYQDWDKFALSYARTFGTSDIGKNFSWHTLRDVSSAAALGHANLVINGTLNISNNGALYTTSHGGNISSEGTGKIVFNVAGKNTGETLYECFTTYGRKSNGEAIEVNKYEDVAADQVLVGSYNYGNNYRIYGTPVTTTPAQLHNADGSFTSTSGAPASTTVHYKHGHWGWKVIWKLEDGTVLKTAYYYQQPNDSWINTNKPSETHPDAGTSSCTYTFTGWNKTTTSANQEIEMVALFTRTCPAYYDITWKSEDGTATLETDLSVGEGETTRFNGDIPTKASDFVNYYAYEFDGWTTAPNGDGTFYTKGSTPAAAGDATYYAHFNAISMVASVTIGGETHYYTSLQETFSAANSAVAMPTITILRDISGLTEKIDYTGSQNCTLDLNGHIVSGTATRLLYINNANTAFTVTDLTEDKLGKLSLTPSSNSEAAFCAYVVNGTLQLEAGTVYLSSNQRNAGGVRTEASGTFVMNGGKVHVKMTGSLTGYGVQTLGTATINGGTVRVESSKDGYGIYVSPTGFMTVNNGNFHITGATASYACNTAAESSALLIKGGYYSTKRISDGQATVSDMENDYVAPGKAYWDYAIFDLTSAEKAEVGEEYNYKVSEAYTLTWVTDGEPLEGTYISGLTAVGSTIIPPNTPAKLYYAFNGWSNGTSVVTPTTMPASNTTYTATWMDADEYTVSFDLQGHGLPISAQTVAPNALVTEPSEPAVATYFFGGWYKESACVNAWNFGTDRVKANITLYAKWMPAAASVTTGGESDYYATITEAFAVANSAGLATTIRLLQDVSIGNEILTYNGTKNCTLDLNGHTITGTDTRLLCIDHAGITFTVTDNSGSQSGKLSLAASSNDAASFCAYINSGILQLEAGTIHLYSTSTAKNAGSVRAQATGTFTMNGGTVHIVMTKSGRTGYGVQSLGTTTINGGTVRAESAYDCYGIMRSNTGSVTVNGGKFHITGTTASYACNADAPNTALLINGGYYSTKVMGGGADLESKYVYPGRSCDYYIYDLTSTEKAEVGEAYNYKVSEAYTLTWVTDGDPLEGSYTSGLTPVGTPIIAPDTPTKTDYTFVGWSDGSSFVTPTTMPSTNTTYTATWIKVVATVTIQGETSNYADFSDAWTAANSSTTYPSTITLYQDVEGMTEKLEYTCARNCTLDLNGHTISGTATRLLYINNAKTTFTVTDLSDDKLGTLSLTPSINTEAAFCAFINSGTFKMDAGTVYIHATLKNSGGVRSQAGSTFTMNGGTVHVVTGSGLTGYGVQSLGTATINGGTVRMEATSVCYGTYIANSGTITVNGGKFHVTGASAYTTYTSASNTALQIKGGYYNTTNGLTNYVAPGKNTWNYYLFALTAAEKTEVGSEYNYKVAEGYTLSWISDGDDLTGTYTSGLTAVGTPITAPDTPTKTGYIFAGWSPAMAATMPAANTTYTATWARIVVATVTINGETTEYADFSDAWTAANGSTTYPSTITLYQDVEGLTEKLEYTCARNCTLDLNGHKISGTATRLLYINNASATFTVTDLSEDKLGTLSLTPSIDTEAAFCVYINSGSFQMEAGTVYIHAIWRNSGGVRTQTYGSSSFIMNGGTVHVVTGGNLTAYGVQSLGAATIHNGTVRVESAKEGYGIYVANSGMIRVNGGKFHITGGTASYVANTGVAKEKLLLKGGYYNTNTNLAAYVSSPYSVKPLTPPYEEDGKTYGYMVTHQLDNLVITDEQTIADNTEAVTTTVTVSGSLTIETGSTLTTTTLILEGTPNSSGEITGAGTVTATQHAYFDFSNGTEGFKARTWYAVAVPWQVNAETGVSFNGSTKTLGRDFDLIYYDGLRRSQGITKAWNYVEDDLDKTMLPGRAYMIYLIANAPAIRFERKAETPLQTTSLETKKYASDLGDNYADWNGIANPATFHAYLNVGATEGRGQVYNGDTKQYEMFNMSEHKLVVGQPIFVQPKTAKTIVASDTYSTYAPAPRRVKEAMTPFSRYELILAPSEADETDRIIIRMNEDKEDNNYVVGQDLVKMGVSDRVPQMWINRYESKMCINTVAPINNTADYPLGISVQKDGEYDLFIDNQPDDNTMLYLTYDGEVIWNLSYGGYVASLNKGTNNHYGLRIVYSAPRITTGIEEATIQNGEAIRKVVVNDQVYIIRNGDIYSVTGQKIK